MEVGGEKRDYEARAMVREDGCFVIDVRNITERKEAERAFRESDDRFWMLASSTPTLLWLTDPIGRFTFVNDRWLSFTGRTMTEEVGDGWANGIHPEDVERCLATYRQGIQRQSAFEVEYRQRRHDGEYRWMLSQGVPHFGNGGALEGFVGSNTDISERRRLEEESLANLRHVEGERERAESACRALALQTEELAMARNAAVKATRETTAFLAQTSHEIRTPLNGIVGLAELLADTTLDATQREYLNGILDSSAALMSLIDDLIDLSKLEMGRIGFQSEPFSPRSVAEALVRTVLPTAKAKGLTLALEVEGVVPDVLLGDEHRLRQILLNLITNAIQFTERGSVRIRLRCKGTTADRSLIHFEVLDTGIGIPESRQQRIFEPVVHRAEDSVERGATTGLGLAISAKLVARMLGKIWVESVPGRGSSFQFIVPFSLASEGEHRIFVAQRTRGGSADSAAGGIGPDSNVAAPSLDVLLADDSRVGQLLVTRLLEKWGHRLTVVENGRQAVEAAALHSYDVILMDLQMPELDGFGATAEIREAESEGTRIPILALTAAAMTGDRERCLAAGMDGHLTKPVRAAELRAALGRIVPSRRAA